MVGFTLESARYAKGAVQFASYAQHIENGEKNISTAVDHHNCVIASITFSAFMLEAAINEFVSSTKKDTNGIRFINVSEEIGATIGRFIDLEKQKTLEKYENLVFIMTGKEYDKGSMLYQDVSSLIRTRNLLAHYKMVYTNMVSEGAYIEEIDKLKRSLKGKFVENTLFGESVPYFPSKFASTEAARWFFNASRDFVIDFYEKIDYEMPSILPDRL